MDQELTHQLPLGCGDIEPIIRAHPTRYELFFSVQQGQQSTPSEPIKLGEIPSKALTHRRSGKESPNTGSHFAIYAQGAYGKPCFEPAHFEFAEWKVAAGTD
jgi:hypothetical protein